MADKLRRVYGATHTLVMELLREGPMLRVNYTLLDNSEQAQRGRMSVRPGMDLAGEKWTDEDEARLQAYSANLQ